jgi:hypothetical protein
MTKKKKLAELPVTDLLPGARVVWEGTTHTVRKVESIIDPRGGVYLDSPTNEVVLIFDDGLQVLTSGSIEIAA